MRIGFIGAGKMGRPMALNLLGGGHELLVYDSVPQALVELVSAGARSAASVAAVARESEVVFTSLPSLKAVESVFLGDQGLISGARPGQILVDLSTILPSLAQRVHAAALDVGVETLDAPVSGGTLGAEGGTLSIMVGGDEGAFQQVKGLLELLGNHIYYVGPSGAGTRMKLINQLLVAVNHIAAMEAMGMAFRGGMELDRVQEIIAMSAGDSKAFQLSASRVRSRDFEAGASIDILEKDSELVLALAEESEAYVPMLRLAREIYQHGQEIGLGSKDMCALIQLFDANCSSSM